VKRASLALPLVNPHGRIGSMTVADFKHIRIKDVNGIAVIQFVNSQLMFEAKVVDEIGDELESLISDHSYPKIVLDFSDVQYVSSTMLAKLAKLQKHADVSRRQLKLCGLGPILQDTFRIGHLERMFSIYNDAESALQSF
jgi:anti-sigma B factor antagonist